MIDFPVFARAKMRGVYCRIVNERPVRVDGQPIVNMFVRDILAGMPPFEGTLLFGDTWDEEAEKLTIECLAEPDIADRFAFWVHDIAVRDSLSFVNRIPMMASWVVAMHAPPLHLVPYVLCHDATQLEIFRLDVAEAGHPDITTIRPDARYEAPTSHLN